MSTVAASTSKPVMVVRITEPVSAVQWTHDSIHTAVVPGFTRWADAHDKAEHIHDVKESKLIGQRGKVYFGMLDGDTPVEQGDYILTHYDGFREVVRPAEFEALYRPATKAEIEAAAETADDSVKIVVMEPTPDETAAQPPKLVGETGASRFKKPV